MMCNKSPIMQKHATVPYNIMYRILEYSKIILSFALLNKEGWVGYC
jgi:hypothetical protein